MAAAMREKKTVDERMVREVPNALRVIPGQFLQAEDPKWEYRTVLASRNADLNQYGEQGWELVSAIPQPADQVAYYFKRRK
jgi:hypothetical protein